MATIDPVLDVVDDVEGDNFDIDHDENFPSGSAWGQEQLGLLRFPIQPERLSFDVLTLECILTEAHLRVIQSLKAGFGVPMEDWTAKEVEGFYRDFYDSLQEMMPRIRPKQATPHKKPLRSSLETIPLSSPALPGSSHGSRGPNISAIKEESDSEDSVATPASNQTTPSRPRKRARLGGSPNPLDIRNYDTETANCPENTAIPMSNQTDKTYNESDKSSNNSGDDISQGDRPEIDVTVLIQGMIRHICKAYAAFVKDYTFGVKFEVERLTIPIAGLFPRKIPDLLITMLWNGRIYSLFDYEVIVPLFRLIDRFYSSA
ncbi:unnamed protein product [Sphagnum balticum]